MDKQKKLLYNCIILLLILLLLYGLIKLYPVYKVIILFTLKLLLPFVIAAFISYLIHPLLIKLEQYKIKKSLSIFIIFLTFIGIILVMFYKSIPIFIFELQELSEQLPQLLQMYEQMIYNIYESTSFLPEVVHDRIDDFISNIEARLNERISGLLEKLINISDIIVLIAIIPVLIFYFLKDYPLIIQWLTNLLPERYHHRFNRIVKAVDESLGNYVRGQLIISSVIVAITYLVYHLLDIKYALVLAVIMGLMNIIPYFGPIIGTLPVVAIAMTVSFRLVIIVIAINIIVQLIESSFLSSYIMGKNVKIHPILLILTLLIGAELGGLIGMIIAVPSVTILRAIFLQFRLDNQHT